MRYLVVGNSPDCNSASVAAVAAPGLPVVALDGAARKIPVSISPSIVCGDFDSISPGEAALLHAGAEIVQLQDQNENDFEKALRLLAARGAREVLACGVLGGRPDQNLANLGVIVRHHGTLSICALHCGMECRVASPGVELRLSLRAGDEVSVVPFGSSATISLAGVRWPLERELLNGGSHGVSNVAIGGEVLVIPQSGNVFVFSKQRLVSGCASEG